MINWDILELKSNRSSGLVVSAVWMCTYCEDGVTISDVGYVPFQAPENEIEIKPFSEITKTDVLNWVFSILSKEDIEAYVISKAQIQKNPDYITDNPWD